MRRRDFLRTAGCFVVSAGASRLLVGCGSDGGGDESGAAGLYAFPQGVASGDPRPRSVMLWTRVQPTEEQERIAVRLELSRDEAFAELDLMRELEVTPASDYTLRVLVEELEPDTIYFYRFVAGSDPSRVGRTWTAPERDADVPVRFAWASCQDYSAGFYGAYRRMLRDDADADDKLRFVLHVGDFIYETRGEGFQNALNDDLEPVELVDASGEPRQMPPFPSGGGSMNDSEGRYARELDDYRHIYKTYLADPDLQDARAHLPFVCVWDDHEFSDDCWQSQANFDDAESLDEPSQQRRVAASRAWFEYIPAILSESEDDDVTPEASDFDAPSDVENAMFEDLSEPNNAAAIGAITIYRRLRFGKHVDLVLTDNRSYRSDHAVPEQLTAGNPLAFHPRAGLPKDVVVTLDAGRTADGGSPPDEVAGYENVRKDSAPGTLLGDEQKAWLKAVLESSTASFKVWGNSVPLMRILLDASDVALIPNDLVLSADSWDGYPTERNELMTFLRERGIRNVISLSGDHHAHFAGLVHDDFDADEQTPVMVDFAAAGISSTSQWGLIAGAVETAVTPDLQEVVAPILKVLFYDSTPLGGEDEAVVNMNALIRYGSAAANVAADTHDLDQVEAARDPSVNPHLRFTNVAAHGYGVAAIDGREARITLVTIEPPLEDHGEDGAPVRGTASFVVPHREEGEPVTLDEPALTGQKPFPLR